jgi:sulfite exporter TauE/SafE
MTLLIAMFPIYLMGNLHCLGMCGPLAMMIGNSPYRGYYLMGRMLSFTMAGALAGMFGYVIASLLQPYHLSYLFSLGLGISMLLIGAFILLGKSPGIPLLSRYEKKMSALLFHQGPWALFLFGFFTIALPCGQTLLVFSACALSGSAAAGTVNGLAFALLTTPSLLLAMHAKKFVNKAHKFYRPVVGVLAILVGIGAIYRGVL